MTDAAPATIAWVIGARGLLGSSLVAAIEARPEWRMLETEPLPWSDPDSLASFASSNMERLLEAADEAGGAWSVIWVGGAGVTSTPQRQLDEELVQLQLVLDAMSTRMGREHPDGSIFYASTAGGIYAGSDAPPFTELSEPSPISPYGHFKLQAELAIQRFAERENVSSLVGRIANLYGPGQKLDKMQGLISQIARAQYSPAPASIFVSLDTVRDYLYVRDCAELILDALGRLASRGEVEHVTKILASGQAVTIGELLGHFHALVKGHPHIMLGQSPAAALQARDLRLKSVVWPELDYRTLTPLPVGIHATMRAVLSELTG